MNYHVPVLLRESVDGLIWRKDGIYIDATLGGGGHSRAILQQLSDKGHLFAFDQDEDAWSNLPEDERCTCVASNFRYTRHYMEYYGVQGVSGILADLGVSSWQFDTIERGFSHRGDAPLDMRMNRQQSISAADLLSGSDSGQLQDILSKYGEVRNARTLAEGLVARSRTSPIRSTGDLVAACEPHIRGNRNRYLSQVFQALRIAVNDEMGALNDLLVAASELLETGGRLVVLSYHSLEDRLVKRYMKTGNAEGKLEKDEYGNIHQLYKVITNKPVEAGENEIQENPRARSVRLRIAERNK